MLKDGKISTIEQQAEQFEIYTNRFGKQKVVINSKNNLNLYNVILKQIELKTYQSITAFKTLKTIMENKIDIFVSNSVLEQVKCLFNIIVYLRRGDSSGLDLSILKESKKTCALRVGYDITKVDFSIIHQSTCGLVERVQKV